MVKKPGRLTMYYGEECPHCHRMNSLVERLEKGEGLCGEVPYAYAEEMGARPQMTSC